MRPRREDDFDDDDRREKEYQLAVVGSTRTGLWLSSPEIATMTIFRMGVGRMTRQATTHISIRDLLVRQSNKPLDGLSLVNDVLGIWLGLNKGESSQGVKHSIREVEASHSYKSEFAFAYAFLS